MPRIRRSRVRIRTHPQRNNPAHEIGICIDPNQIYTPSMASRALLANERTLERWRTTGYGPRFVKMGRFIRYHGVDLIAFIEQRKRASTQVGQVVRAPER